MNKPYIKKGALVEFTDTFHRDYTIGDKRYARYGICTKDLQDYSKTLEVRTTKGVETAKFVMAHSWIGWIPEELEEIYEKEFAMAVEVGYYEEDY